MRQDRSWQRSQWVPGADCAPAETAWRYFAVGITNSAPLAVLSGQRSMIDFCLV
jgi:hypothetical protein